MKFTFNNSVEKLKKNLRVVQKRRPRGFWLKIHNNSKQFLKKITDLFYQQPLGTDTIENSVVFFISQSSTAAVKLF